MKSAKDPLAMLGLGFNEAGARKLLEQVIDPELGINIVDLGLIYEVRVEDSRVSVRMTMTTAACPVGEYLRKEVEDLLRSSFPEAKDVDVALVFEPAWDPSRMSPSAKTALGW